MKNNMVKIVLLVLSIFYIAGCSLKDPINAPDLLDEELDIFLNSPFGFGPVKHSDTVKDVFYSGEQKDGFLISVPKYLGKKDKNPFYAIIISEQDISVNDKCTIVVFSRFYWNDEQFLDYVEQREGKIVKRYDFAGDKNNVLINIFPSDFFNTVALDWEIQMQQNREAYEADQQRQREERLANQTPEGWPNNSVYTSHLFLRDGIDDVRGRVGDIFYMIESEYMDINRPINNGAGNYMIQITSKDKNNSTEIRVYLKYSSAQQTSMLDRITVIDQGRTQTLRTFEDKLAGLIMIGSAIRQ